MLTLAIVCLNLVTLGVLVWRESQHQRLVLDLTAKIMAKDLTDYRQIVVDKPREKKEPKPKNLDHC